MPGLIADHRRRICRGGCSVGLCRTVGWSRGHWAEGTSTRGEWMRRIVLYPRTGDGYQPD